ncbi:MAG: hypothetical protein WC329_01615 [Candidatus Omnitrophota bacterium]|jgi:rubrerythrin
MNDKVKKPAKDKGDQEFVCTSCGTPVDNPFDDCPKCGNDDPKLLET